jgi:Spy/CpxP family protein refolding chaperone
MDRVWKSIALTVLLAAAASGVGAWAGANWVLKTHRPPALHEIVHRDLDLTARQLEQIETIERRFASRRQELEREVQAANLELAQAIESSGGDSRVVQPAVHHFHDAMGKLQEETIAHIFEMRRIMTPEQAAEFDRAVARALTAETS